MSYAFVRVGFSRIEYEYLRALIVADTDRINANSPGKSAIEQSLLFRSSLMNLNIFKKLEIQKWAVWAALDQTIGFLTEGGSWTTNHEEAWLVDTEGQAEIAKEHAKGDGVEAITDVEEFRLREDTW